MPEDGEMMEADNAEMVWMMGTAKFHMNGRHANNTADKESYRVFDSKFDEKSQRSCDPKNLTAYV